MAEPGTSTLREATFDDCEGASSLLRKLGLSVPADPAAARRGWDRFWRDNPAQKLDRPHPPLGWVLEDGGAIVGFFGSIPLRYSLGDRTLLVADASQWGVEKPYRGRTGDLATAYFAQREVDLFLVTTGIRSTGRIFDRFSASPMPVRAYDRVLFWVLDAARFLHAALRKKAVRPVLARAGSLALAPLLAAVNAVPGRRLGRRRAGLEPEVIPLSAVGDAFDDLWRRKIAEGRRRLLAYRMAEDLRWHFGPGDALGTVDVVQCRRGGRLDGYLILQHEAPPSLGMARARIVDMLVAGDDEAVIDALVAAADGLARDRGAHVLELVGFPAAIRARAERSRPFGRMFPTSPFHYKPASPGLAADLREASAWYPTLYDGDSSL